MASTWGENIKLSIFGGSHTEAIGMVLDISRRTKK